MVGRVRNRGGVSIYGVCYKGKGLDFMYKCYLRSFYRICNGYSDLVEGFRGVFF